MFVFWNTLAQKPEIQFWGENLQQNFQIQYILLFNIIYKQTKISALFGKFHKKFMDFSINRPGLKSTVKLWTLSKLFNL